MIKFIVIGDPHWGGYEEWIEDRVDWLFDTIEKDVDDDTEFILLNGDVVHGALSKEERLAKKPILNDLVDLVDCDVYMTHGNHDEFSDLEFADFTENIANQEKDFSFEIGDYAFIGLDSYDGSHTCPDLGYLQDQVDNFDDKKEIFVFSHRNTTDNVTCEDWHNYMVENDLVGVYSHDHSKYRHRKEDGHTYYHTGHFTDKDHENRQHWIPFHSYRVFEIENDNIISYIRDATNYIDRNESDVRGRKLLVEKMKQNRRRNMFIMQQ